MTKPKGEKFYITTAIDYVNSLPHIGTAYEKIGADVLARWHRICGDDVHFQMGNDEHSINVKKAADERGISPKAYCDEMRGHFEKIWRSLDISFDGFIQTSDPHHEKGVQKLFAAIMEKGDIYKARYEGWYCESCEAFLTEKDLTDGLCPNHKSKPAWLAEENYFFALSKYRDKLRDYIKAHPEFILPDVRRNEIMSLLDEGLQDVSVSRSTFDWGVKLPSDPAHIVYVWFDALINYITAIGFGWDEAQFQKWWPADIHVIGKDITRFHCVIWPAMLMSACIPLPRTVFGHGFVYLRGEKMSKTLGNVVTPMDVIAKFGPDPLRYYLLREGGFGRDADFTWEHFIERYNGDLANGIGNLVSRTMGMATRYQDGEIRPAEETDKGSEIALATAALPGRLAEALDHSRGEVEFHQALAGLWGALAAADRHINDHKPWEMAKRGEKEAINRVLWEVASCLRVAAILLGPFMPRTAAKIWGSMGFDALGELSAQKFEHAALPWGALNKSIKVKAGEGLFPRIEPETEAQEKPVKPAKEKSMTSEPTADAGGRIDISEFAKIDLRVAVVVAAERVEGADKLLKLRISLGSEERQIVAGIAKHYAPEELVGRRVVVVANLKPAKLRGIDSDGMLLAASDESTVSILTPLKDVAIGSKVK
ncbi:MAG: methionine--tRNA ligase [bacterium]